MNGVWIWRYKDFEFYHGVKYLLAREERGKKVPAFYVVPNYNHSVRFMKKYNLDEEQTFSIFSDGDACVSIDGERMNGADKFTVPAGEHNIIVHIGNQYGICALKIVGDVIFSDESWETDCYNDKWQKAATSDLLLEYDGTPSTYDFPEEKIIPESDEINNCERIIKFSRNTFVKVVLRNLDPSKKTYIKYGESLEETYSDRCVIVDEIEGKTEISLPARACQYIRFLGNIKFDFEAYYPKSPIKDISHFKADKEMVDIYNISKYTLELCSRMFLLDGIKRDRWPWAGDSFLTSRANYYSFFDKDLVRRTLILLRGNDQNEVVINKIPGFSMYWFMIMYDYYLYTGDLDFIKKNYNSMKLHMEYLRRFCDVDGLIDGLPGWNFIDHHDIETRGKVCCIQMLYGKALESFSKLAFACGEIEVYKKNKELYDNVFKKINDLYWNDALHGYVSTIFDGVASSQVRRHQNYFAVLFGYADKSRTNDIMKFVVYNDDIPKITTPFFKYFENDLLCQCGKIKEAFADIRKYWGDMIKAGATTCWEEFDSQIKGVEQYAMYGDPFDKSLCHAWGAVPIYFVGKYLAGVMPTSSGYSSFIVDPKVDVMDFEVKVPICNGYVEVRLKEKKLTVLSTKKGGTLLVNSNKYELEANRYCTVEI